MLRPPAASPAPREGSAEGLETVLLLLTLLLYGLQWVGLPLWRFLLVLGWLLLWVQYLWERLLPMLLWTRVLLQDVGAAQ